MDPDKVSEWSRTQLLAYLSTRIGKRAGKQYKHLALLELTQQPTEKLRALAVSARELQLEKRERRRLARLARKEQHGQHTD